MHALGHDDVVTAGGGCAHGGAGRRPLVQVLETSIGTLDAAALGLGGFTLDVHHAYDPVGQVLYQGDGTRRATAALPLGIRTVAGNGVFLCVSCDPGHGRPALEASLFATLCLASAPDGSLYVVDDGVMVRRLRPDGILELVAGRWPQTGFAGDGGPATQALLSLHGGTVAGSAAG